MTNKNFPNVEQLFYDYDCCCDFDYIDYITVAKESDTYSLNELIELETLLSEKSSRDEIYDSVEKFIEQEYYEFSDGCLAIASFQVWLEENYPLLEEIYSYMVTATIEFSGGATELFEHFTSVYSELEIFWEYRDCVDKEKLAKVWAKEYYDYNNVFHDESNDYYVIAY